MNNTYVTILTTLVRVAFMWLMGALASHLSPKAYDLANTIITQLGGTEAVILWIVGALGAAGLSVWVRLAAQVHLRTALALPKGATVEEVKKASPNPLTLLADPKPPK